MLAGWLSATAEFESLVTDGADTFFKLKRGQLVRGFSGSPLDRADDAISELQAAVPARTRQEITLDEADTALLNRFRDPPLPGLELLLQFFEPPPADPQAG